MAIKLPEGKTVVVPPVQNGRAGEPNPFEPIVAELNAKRGTAKAFPFPNKTEADKAELRSAKNAAHRAGRAAGVSVRVRIEEDAKKGTALFTVWVVDKITRERAASPEGLAEEVDPR